MNLTVHQALSEYIENIHLARSQNTARTYSNAIHSFELALANNSINPFEQKVNELSVEAISWFAVYLKDYSPATEILYLTVAAGFFEFLSSNELAKPNLPRMRMLIRQRSRRQGQRLPQFPRNAIEDTILYAISLIEEGTADVDDQLRNLRDRAFLLTLADTGLRVHEACNLRRGDIDWNESRAVIIGKGDRQNVVRFSKRSIQALRDYLKVRSSRDGASGKPLASLPLFSRHDRGAGKKIKPITPTTGRNIVSQRIRESLGEDYVGTITPHSFRHYFVTTVLQGSGGNLKLAQELARHRNIAVTQRYAHLSDDELDKGYYEVFEQSDEDK